jgi:hypothetical protein
MSHRLPDHCVRRDFLHAVPASAGDDSTDALRRWLATADFLLAERVGDATCSVLVLVSEESDEIEVYAVPDAEIGASMRADLDRAHRANFELFFTADLAPEQFAGVLWFLSATDVEGVRGLRGDLEAEIAQYDVAIDWPAVDAAWGSWTKHRLESGASPPGRVSRIYTANYAP